MTTTSPWLRVLQVFACVLGIANAVLVVMWVQMDPPAPPQSILPGAAIVNLQKVTPTSAAIEVSATAQKNQVVPEPAQSGSLSDALAPSAMLFGTMRSADGELVENGYCWLFRDGKNVGNESLSKGTFAFVGLQLGEYRLRTRIEDQLPLERGVLVDRARTRLDIVLDERWLLAVNAVTPDGEPLLPSVAKELGGFGRRGIVALAFAEPRTVDLPASNHAEVAAGLGTFRGQAFPPRGKALPKQTVGMLALPSGQPLHVALLLRNVIVAQQQVQPGQKEVTFVLSSAELLAKTASVSMRLVDESGMPVAGANVALNDAQTGGGGRPTDEAGRITLSNLMPGSLDLEIRHRELSAPSVQIEVAAGARIDLGDVMLRPFVPLAFDLSNFGEGKGSVRFNLLDPPRNWIAKDSYASTENGSSATYHVYPGRYGLVASGPKGVAVLEVDAHVAPAAPIRFELRPGAELRIDCKLAGSWARLDLQTPAGAIVRRRELSGDSQESVRLPAGAYVAIITDQAGVDTRRSITLGSEGAVLTVP